MLKAGHLVELVTIPDPEYPTRGNPDKQPSLIDLKSIAMVYPFGHYCTLRFNGVDQYVIVDMTYQAFKDMLREQDSIKAIMKLDHGD